MKINNFNNYVLLQTPYPMERFTVLKEWIYAISPPHILHTLHSKIFAQWNIIIFPAHSSKIKYLRNFSPTHTSYFVQQNLHKMKYNNIPRSPAHTSSYVNTYMIHHQELCKSIRFVWKINKHTPSSLISTCTPSCPENTLSY